ncbi:MAG: hemolysin family protein [Verrucomicrobiota bacterium]
MNAISFELVIILLLFLANGVFAMTEMAMVSSRKSRLRMLADSGDRGARAALKLVEEPNRFLPSVQVGITLVGLLAGAFGGATLAREIAKMLAEWPALSPYAEAIGMGVVVVTLTFLSLVIGELVPKRLALSNPERIAGLMARPLDLLSRLARPVIWMLGVVTDAVLFVLRVKPKAPATVSEDEVKSLMQEGSHTGVFHPAEPRMVESVLAFDQRPVTDIMTPRGKVIFIRRDENPETLWHKIVVSGHNHFPVYDSNRNRIVGVISVKAVYANVAVGVVPNVVDLMVAPLFVTANRSVASLLETFKASGQHIGIVVDKRNNFLGVITLVDVLEAIVGELPSLEERLRPEARRRDDGSWLVDGAFEVAKIWEQLEVEASVAREAAPKQKLGAYVSARLSGAAAEGKCFSTGGWRFEVLDMDGERVDKVLVTPEAEKP